MGLSSVPVSDVTKENIHEFIPSILMAIRNGSYLGIDCELSGLGNRKKINDPLIEQRYKYASTVVKTRSLLAIGLSVFRKLDEEKDNYSVSTFNLTTLCTQDYIVEPESLKFLVQHQFDFNKQYSHGIPYTHGDDKGDDGHEVLRFLFEEIVRSKIPIVLHNGFLDLMFLYQNLYARLPIDFQSFVADIHEMFPGGIYDTKYISEYVLRIPSTYLSFLFAKSALDNNKNGYLENLKLQAYPYQDEIQLDLSSVNSNKSICGSYSNHGHCPNKGSCQDSHDVVAIVRSRYAQHRLNQEENQRVKKRKLEAESGIGHSAGFDAFMTVYTLISNLNRLQKDKVINRIYLVAKEFPLLVQKSAFAKNSLSHYNKMKKISERNEV